MFFTNHQSHLNHITMPGNNRNRNSQKETDKDKQSGMHSEPYRKLPNDPNLDSSDSPSTANDTSGGKYSKTSKRDDEVDNDDTRGGR